MRVLTVLAGAMICLTGVFCFAVYINPFSDVAFLIGLVMILAGIMHTISYLISGRGEQRLTDTALVEGIVTALYGFAVMNNQVTDNILFMFFGTWATLCGITRVSQSLFISRFNRRDWAKVMPLGIVTAMLGIVMMMPMLLNGVQPLMLIGGAFLINGLGILVYAMYMRRKDAEASVSELSAKQRAEAKKQIKRAKQQEKEQMKKLSSEERAALKAQKEADKRALKEAQAAEKNAVRDARKKERQAVVQGGETMMVSREEVEEIRQQAPDEQLKEDARVAAKAAEKPASRIASKLEAAAALEAASKVSIKLPDEIPSIKVELEEPEQLKESKAEPELKIPAINLAEIEEAPKLDLPQVELPKPELASETEKRVDREHVLSQLESVETEEAEVIDYTPLDLDELFGDLPPKEVSEKEQEKEKKRFTQVLNFDWVEPDFTEVKYD